MLKRILMIVICLTLLFFVRGTGNPGWATVYTLALDSDADAGEDIGYRWVIPNASISGNGTQVRLTVEAHSTQATILDGLSIGQRNGTTDDYIAGAFTRVTFVDEGGGNAITIPAGTEVVSDAIDVTGWPGGILDSTKDHLVHCWLDDHGQQYIYLAAGGGRYMQYNGNVDDTLTQTIAYGEIDAGSGGILNKIEAYTADAEENAIFFGINFLGLYLLVLLSRRKI